jgi:hypothetical protein
MKRESSRNSYSLHHSSFHTHINKNTGTLFADTSGKVYLISFHLIYYYCFLRAWHIGLRYVQENEVWEGSSAERQKRNTARVIMYGLLMKIGERCCLFKYNLRYSTHGICRKWRLQCAARDDAFLVDISNRGDRRSMSKTVYVTKQAKANNVYLKANITILWGPATHLWPVALLRGVDVFQYSGDCCFFRTEAG